MSFDVEKAQQFCMHLADGKTIRQACKEDGMPSMATVFRWLREYPEFQKLYDVATDQRADVLVDEMVAIADNCKTDTDAIRKAKLRIYARERQVQLMKPRKYGAKLQLSGDGGGPIVHRDVTGMTDDELLAIATRDQGKPNAGDA